MCTQHAQHVSVTATATYRHTPGLCGGAVHLKHRAVVQILQARQASDEGVAVVAGVGDEGVASEVEAGQGWHGGEHIEGVGI